MNDINEPQINPREPHYQGPANNHVPELTKNDFDEFMEALLNMKNGK